ncbi:thermonuclease family protein [Candidatus Leptofilum sp.]|uniref:thermonuclease family protein n=1 Tax=Candidatus Leptofilum sp. TaxID=3241576 RepID=UPI003B58EF44
MKKTYNFDNSPLRWLLLLVLLLAACDLLPPPAPSGDVLASDAPQLPNAPSETAVVTEVIDGDTIRVLLDGRTYRVRYIGIDTPERDEACFADATNANAAWVEGQTVRLVQDESNTDRFDRLLRYVYVDEVLVNAELVAGGWAESKRYPPDDELFDYLEGLEANAADQQLGCHPAGVFAP